MGKQLVQVAFYIMNRKGYITLKSFIKKHGVDSVGYPYDGAKTFLDRVIINFVDVEVVDDVFIENRNRHLGKIIL